MNRTAITLSALPLLAAGLLASAKPADAQVVLNLQQPFQSGTAGSTFQFFGTITNFGPAAVYLTGDTHSVLAPGVTLDDSPFLFDAPSLLSSVGTAGSSYTGEIFDVTIAPGTASGFYSGLFTLTGGPDPIANGFDTLNTNGFSIAAVPEASSMISFSLLLLGGAGMLAFGRTRARKQSA